MLFKLPDVLVAATQQVPGLMGGFRGATGLKAHRAEWDSGTSIEPRAQCLAAAGPGPRCWAAQIREDVHVATSTLDAATVAG
jgi:hypothetical protein